MIPSHGLRPRATSVAFGVLVAMAWGLVARAADPAPTASPPAAMGRASIEQAQSLGSSKPGNRQTSIPSDPLSEQALPGAGWPGPKPDQDRTELPVEALRQLTIDQAMVWASQRNPVVAAAFQQLLAAQNTLGSAYASWWPNLNVSLNGGLYGERAYYNYPGALMGGFSAPAGSSAGAQTRSFLGSYFQSIGQVDSTWNLIDPARSPTIWQNKYLVRQAADNFIIAQRDNKLQTQTAFIDLQRAYAQRDASVPIVENDQLLTRLALAKFRLGVASKLDVAKQETVLYADKGNLQTALQNISIAQANLAALLVTTRVGDLSPATPLAPLGRWNYSLDRTIAASFDYRKILEQKLLDVKTNEAQAQIELATYRPTLQLINTLYWTKGVGYTTVGPPWIGNARSDLWNGSALLQLTFTGFDGGLARLQAAASLRKARAAQLTYEATVIDVRKEVQTLFAQAENGRQSVLLSASELKAANQAIRLQAQRFSAGYGTATDVVQAQQNLAQSVISYINTLADYNIALVNLSRNTGLEFSPDPDLVSAVGNPLKLLRLPTVLDRFR